MIGASPSTGPVHQPGTLPVLPAAQGAPKNEVELKEEVTPRTGPLLSVILPVYNEAATIRELLTRVLAAPIDLEILVVDDGSTDGTRTILGSSEVQALQLVRVILRDQNRGKGAAIRTAIPEVRGRYVVIQDGDLEYNPDEYSLLVKPLEEGVADIVYGSRFLAARPAMQPANRLVNWLLARMVRLLYGFPMTDEATCYKAFRTDTLRSIPLRCNRFEFCPEVTAKALRRGYRLVEVPISYHPRSNAQGKKIRWTDGIEAIATLLRYRFWR